MNIKFKKALAASSLTLALGGLAVGMTGVAAAVAVDAPGISGDSGSAVAGATTVTLPWCGWHVAGLPSTLNLVGDEATGTTAKYAGLEIPLSSTADNISTHVGGSSTYSSADDNCSWFDDSKKQAVKLTIAADGTAFIANAGENPDAGMNFDLNGSTNALHVTATPVADSCSNFGVTPSASIGGATLSSPTLTSPNVAGVTTKNVCAFSLEFATKIPGGMIPAYGDQTYNYTGPTVTSTLEIAQ
jgi:hypothetical protein